MISLTILKAIQYIECITTVGSLRPIENLCAFIFWIAAQVSLTFKKFFQFIFSTYDLYPRDCCMTRSQLQQKEILYEKRKEKKRKQDLMRCRERVPRRFQIFDVRDLSTALFKKTITQSIDWISWKAETPIVFEGFIDFARPRSRERQKRTPQRENSLKINVRNSRSERTSRGREEKRRTKTNR